MATKQFSVVVVLVSLGSSAEIYGRRARAATVRTWPTDGEVRKARCETKDSRACDRRGEPRRDDSEGSSVSEQGAPIETRGDA